MATRETAVNATAMTRPSRERSAGMLQVMRVIWLREMLVYSRDRGRVISSLIFPLLMLVFFGEGLRSSIGNLGADINYLQFIFPGIIAMNILFTSVFAGTTIIWDRQFGFLREILVAPISRLAIGAGKVLGGATIAVFQGCVLFALAPLVGIDLSISVMVQLLGVMIVMALTMTSVGIAIASRMKSVESFQMVTQMTIMPMMFLSGMFFPVNNVPGWMEVLIKVNPITYAVAPLRAIALDKELAGMPGADNLVNVHLFGHTLTTLEELAILAAFGAVMLMIAVQSFRKTG